MLFSDGIGKGKMLSKNSKKIKVPTEAERKISARNVKWADQIFKIDHDNYRESSITLSSDNYEQFYEAMLLTEKCLYNNSCWDVRKETASSENIHTCELYFKWSGTVSIYDRIMKNLKLPGGVKWKFDFDQ